MQRRPHDSEFVLFPATIEADGEGFEPLSLNAHQANSLRQSQNPSEARSEAVRANSDLAAVVKAWPTLSEPIKAGIMAMIRAACRGDD